MQKYNVPMQEKTYIAIDLKSFYASVECVERGKDPMTTCLVVADPSRTEKTICLAVSPALKAYGISGRARLFEVVQRVREVNTDRRRQAPGRELTGSSSDANVLKYSSQMALDYIIAPPQMAHYMEVSTQIYQVYLKYFAPEDMHVYSIDEVMIDATQYLSLYQLTARELAMKVILDILVTTGITATAGIGTNLYLCKVAMDIGAKHTKADANGVRIAELNEHSYRERLWNHRPLTDFWRVGRGYARKLEEVGIYTMGDIARCSIGEPNDYYNEELLYRLFGVNAELLIDHAWGWEPCTMQAIKAYKPRNNSIGSGQVLQCPYAFDQARLVAREMTDMLVLDLVEKRLMTDQLVLTVGYDIDNLTNPEIAKSYHGAVTTDHFGRKMPKHAHGTVNLKKASSSSKVIIDAVMDLFDRIVNSKLLVRRIYVTANHVVDEKMVSSEPEFEQLSLFVDYEAREAEQKAESERLARERKLQEASLAIKKKFGKNAILKGMNLEEGATARQRNSQIGGHKA